MCQIIDDLQVKMTLNVPDCYFVDKDFLVELKIATFKIIWGSWDILKNDKKSFLINRNIVFQIFQKNDWSIFKYTAILSL